MEKFEIGQKVVPISKSYGDPLDKSNAWKNAKHDNQPFLYVVNTKISMDVGEVILCSNISTGTGDYFLEKDLVPYEEEFKYGETIEVYDSDCDKWVERIFVAKTETSPPKYICVYGNVTDENAKCVKNGKTAGVHLCFWEKCRKISFIPVQFPLNIDHMAVIHESHIKVGCQTFGFDIVEKLYEEIQKVKKQINSSSL